MLQTGSQLPPPKDWAKEKNIHYNLFLTDLTLNKTSEDKEKRIKDIHCLKDIKEKGYAESRVFAI